jgi:hypothetical protein
MRDVPQRKGQEEVPFCCRITRTGAECASLCRQTLLFVADKTGGIERGQLTRPRLSRFQAASFFFGTRWAKRRLRSSSSANATVVPRAARAERTLALEKFDLSHAQQVPKPPAPEPDNIPPLPPPDIPVPDPAPPPIENPGDVPLPPITDPDLIEPGDPNPAHSPIRMRSESEVGRPLQTHPRVMPARTAGMSGATYSQVQRYNTQ